MSEPAHITVIEEVFNASPSDGDVIEMLGSVVSTVNDTLSIASFPAASTALTSTV